MPHDAPATTVGLVVAAYWWRVVRMVVKMRRKTGRAANFVPVEPLGRALRLIWQPVIVAWVAIPLYCGLWTHQPTGIRPVYGCGPLRWVAVGVVIASYGVTRVCWRRMGKSWRMGIDPGERTTLVVTGPFAYVRHPIYALSSLMMCGSVVAVPSPALAGVALAHLLLLQWEARREERHLSRVHGPVYDDYRAATGRFLPRLRPAQHRPAGSAP